VLVLAALPLAAAGRAQGVDSWLEAPPAAFVFPLIRVLLGPIYPTLNSVMLSALPKPSHAPMTGLIVVFSALGGTTGSLLTGLAFQKLGGETAFYLTLAPIAALLACMLALHRMRMKRAAG
jgi:fucose permease